MHRRYFVLRAASERGPARLEYYESEKKFRGKAPVPKKAVALETCFNINKRADSKNKHMIVLYTRAESFAVAAENEADQDEWYQAMVELQCKSKSKRTPYSPTPVQTHNMQVRIHTLTHTHMDARTHAHRCAGLRVCGGNVAPPAEEQRTAGRDSSHSAGAMIV
ncbi:Insulin receptor substrate 1 [Liparis tanakae]|uniref:Insulin receptor substrate 1 n=1 Tax=Liparis tanakae TaxID=230148 RepID=A0A4Z2EHB6_9TELE|nr:Insulin receptor substrate 1 [Liparis tanakae]